MTTLINHLIINILSLQMLYINKEYPTYIRIRFKTSQQLLLLFLQISIFALSNFSKEIVL